MKNLTAELRRVFDDLTCAVICPNHFIIRITWYRLRLSPIHAKKTNVHAPDCLYLCSIRNLQALARFYTSVDMKAFPISTRKRHQIQIRACVCYCVEEVSVNFDAHPRASGFTRRTDEEQR